MVLGPHNGGRHCTASDAIPISGYLERRVIYIGGDEAVNVTFTRTLERSFVPIADR